MGPRSNALYSYDDPWRASAFFSALTQLLLTVLVLVHTIFVCITCQLMKWYGWGYRSCHDCVHQSDAPQRFASSAVKKPFNLDSSSSRSSPVINTERLLKRTRSEDFQAVKSRALVCPKCHGVWSLKQGLSFKYNKATSKFRGTPKLTDADSSPIRNVSYVEAGVTSNSACVSKASVMNKLAFCRDSCFEPSGSTQNFMKSDCGSQAVNAVDETRHGMQQLETSIEGNCETSGDTESCLNTPVHGFPGHVMEEAIGLSGRLEDVGSSFKEPIGNGLHWVSINSGGSGIDLESFEATPHLQKEIPREIADELLSVALRKNGDFCKDYDSESVIKGLKAAVFKERKKLCSLYAELEVERISSETAANEAMAMISRLQEEKAALRMQTAHYRRITEERAIYDEQAMELLKDILIKKEKENFLLEKEVKAMRTKFCRSAGKFGKRRQGIYTRSFSAEGQGMLLLKNEEEVDGVHECGTKSEESVGKSHSCLCITEEQPFKRLKAVMVSDSIDLDSGTVRSHSSTELAVSSGSKITHCYGLDHSFDCQQTASDSSRPNDGVDSFDIGLLMQGMPKVFEDKHLLSHHGKLSEASEDIDKSPDGSLVPSTLSTVANSVQELNSSPSGGRDYQVSLVQIRRDGIAENAYEVDKSGECSQKEREVVFLDTGVHLTVDSVASCYSDEVGGSAAACVKEAWGSAGMQCSNMVLEGDTRKDLHASLQTLQANKVSWSCPSSLNHKGSGFNNFEESDSSLLWSHVR